MRGLRRIVDSLQRGLFDDAEPAPPPLAAPAAPHRAAPSVCRRAAAPSARDARARRRRRPIAFLFARSKRRSIGFVVDGDGLSVRAPKWVSLRDVDAAVREKGRWIIARLDEQRERARQQAAARTVWRDGASVAYLGRPLTIVLDPHGDLGAGEAALLDGDGASAPRLRVGLPGDAGEERVKDAVQSWLQREARRIFAARAAHFAERLGVQGPAAVALVGQDALGQRQRQRLGAAALAPDPPSAGDDRLRRRPRARPSARDEPQRALLERRALGRAGVRGGAQGAEAKRAVAAERRVTVDTLPLPSMRRRPLRRFARRPKHRSRRGSCSPATAPSTFGSGSYRSPSSPPLAILRGRLVALALLGFYTFAYDFSLAVSLFTTTPLLPLPLSPTTLPPPPSSRSSPPHPSPFSPASSARSNGAVCTAVRLDLLGDATASAA